MDKKSYVVLCQDCLRVGTTTEPETARCACGGVMCYCAYCMHAVALLRNGERRGDLLGLKIPLLEAWSEQDGVYAK